MDTAESVARALEFACRHRWTVYDMICLELAPARAATLITFHRKLAHLAKAEGVAVAPAKSGL